MPKIAEIQQAATKDRGIKAGIEKKMAPRRLRHGHTTHALKNGEPLKLIHQSLGHEDIATTSLYANVEPDQSNGNNLDL